MSKEKETEEGDDEFKVIASASDTELVVDAIAQRCGTRCPSLVLVHMIYTQLNLNKGLVDQEIETLREKKIYKVLHLPGVQQSVMTVGIIPTKTYLADVDRMVDDKSTATIYSAWIESSSAISTTLSSLQVLGLSQEQIDALVIAGFLRRRETEGFWVGHPFIGYLLQYLRIGQQLVVSSMQRTRFKELTESKLCALFGSKPSDRDDAQPAKKARRSTSTSTPLVTTLFSLDPRGPPAPSIGRTSPLPAYYHILDLLGRDVIRRVERPSGEVFYRLR